MLKAMQEPLSASGLVSSTLAKYLDVFPEELPSVPPQREIEFAIDLIFDAQPISKTTNQMAPAKLL